MRDAPTPTAPVSGRRVRKKLTDLALDPNWQREFDQAEPGGFIEAEDSALAAGAALLAAHRLGELIRAERGQAILYQLDEIRRLLTPNPAPDPAPDPAQARRDRERASRERAWAAYKRAGGTMTLADGSDVKADSHISALRLPSRGRWACRWLGAETVGQLCATTARRLREVKNVGAGTVAEIERELARHGLALATEPQPEST
jgi:hypothetical protein